MHLLTGSLALGLALAAAALEAGAAGVAADKLPPASAKPGLTYTADIKPILDRACLECHGPAKAKAKLRLDSREAILKGGEDGKVVMPGQSARSPLVLATARVGKNAMPPKDKGPPLTSEQVGLIRAWVDQGAR